MNRKTILIAAILLLIGGAAAYFVTQRPGIEEAIELAAEGGERVLREPMRPITDGDRVVIIAMDGVGAQTFLDAVEGRMLPGVAALMGPKTSDTGEFTHGFAVPDVLSVLPSTTLAAWSSIFTGQPPAISGAPGNEWFDRREAMYFAPAPVSVSGIDHALEVYTESLFDGVIATPTLYEQADVRSHVALMHVHRGADLITMPDLGAFDELMTGFIQGITEDTEVKQEIYQGLDDLSVDGAIQAFGEFGIPVLQTVYFPGIDLFTHVAEGPVEAEQRYLRDVIDPALERLFQQYREAGLFDSTYFVFISDHGHTPVLEDDRHALDSEGDSEPPRILEEAGFRLRPFELHIDEKDEDFQATVAYQGAFGYIYLADRSLCPADGDVCDWRAPARLEQDVLPVVRAFDAANLTGAGAPGMEGAIDLILARDPRPVSEDALPFQVWEGDRLVDIGDYLAAHPRPDLLDFEERMRGLAAGPYGHRAGDVLLMAKAGRERDIANRFYFSHSYRSWHGSATAGDSQVPLVVTRPNMSGAEIRDMIEPALSAQPSQLDIVGVVLRLLGK